MTYLIEQLINGICQGAIYALFAIGYTIIVGVVGLVSFTFGEVIMIGAFAALFTATLTGGNILLTILFSFAASGLIGIVIHKICYEKFFESARYIPLICTIGMSMLIGIVQASTKAKVNASCQGIQRLERWSKDQSCVNFTDIVVRIFTLLITKSSHDTDNVTTAL